MALPDVMHTSNPICKYAFRWEIDNFPRTSLEVRGPPFSPIPGYAEKFCFELKFRNVCKSEQVYDSMFKSYDTEVINNCNLDVNLIFLNDRESYLTVVGDIILRNKNKILLKQLSSIRKIKQNATLASYEEQIILSESLSNNSLSEMIVGYSKLTVHGTLGFSGYGVTSSIYSVQQSFDNCGGILKDLKTMHESGLRSDVTLTVGQGKLRAHKAILSCRSPVFAKMFEHDMLENNTNNVTIDDIDLHTFNCFLKFLYTGVVENETEETVMTLYSMAEKYQVKSLQKVCFVLLVNQLSVESVCSVLVLADLHADEELKNVVKIFIRENFINFVGTIKWVELVSTNPKLAEEVLNYIKSIQN